MWQAANDLHNVQPKTCTRSRCNLRGIQLCNLAGDKGLKVVITANEQSIWWTIVESTQRLVATEQGTKVRILIRGHSQGKESLMTGQSMAEAWSRGGPKARRIKYEQAWKPLKDDVEGKECSLSLTPVVSHKKS